MAHLDGRREFPRLCIGKVQFSPFLLIELSFLSGCYYISFHGVPGIGNPPGTMDMKAFLLQKFSSVEREQVRFVFFSSL